MKSTAGKLRVGIKAMRQLGWRVTWPYVWYKLQLSSGILRLRTPLGTAVKRPPEGLRLALPPIPLPERERIEAIVGEERAALISEADEICGGMVRLFGGEPRPLELVPDGELNHWSLHTGSQHSGVDIKFIWEPGRFGWAIRLARAYLLTRQEKYAQAFWKYTEIFLSANPTNRGPHWASAQEVGLRLICLAFAAGVFESSPESSDKRMGRLTEALAAHARRIPPTLSYARAQNNNHLISEAAALYTAGVILPEHHEARRWRQIGRRWLHAGLQAQITADGEYSQHSTNYHRLMLQLALWVHQAAAVRGEAFPEASRVKLAAAAKWLYGLLDTDSGRMPNLGSNDGACIFPLSPCGFEDFRPALQAAGRAFLGRDLLPSGPWDELSAWLVSVEIGPQDAAITPPLRIEGERNWAYLRAADFTSRPSHADQLHLDLWWRGINLAQDGGSFQYNADPPWRNALDATSVHNTLTIDGQDQMRKAGQFLWLDWAQAEVLDLQYDEAGRLKWAEAEHDGYRRMGVIHRRRVSCEGDRWQVFDHVLPYAGKFDEERDYQVRLHWLLPDWDWQLEGTRLRLASSQGEMVIAVSSPQARLAASLGRAGEILAGEASPSPIRGWVSPTYGEKRPALSFAVTAAGRLPMAFTTDWHLPE